MQSKENKSQRPTDPSSNKIQREESGSDNSNLQENKEKPELPPRSKELWPRSEQLANERECKPLHIIHSLIILLPTQTF